ncbi:hypothetical protein QTP88_017164 [Uroleucon formosanum]
MPDQRMTELQIYRGGRGKAKEIPAPPLLGFETKPRALYYSSCDLVCFKKPPCVAYKTVDKLILFEKLFV